MASFPSCDLLPSTAELRESIMSEAEILVAKEGAIRRITLNRPQRLNALTRSLLGDLSDALADLAADDEARVLVLTGAGRGFCAGQDLGDKGAVEDGRVVRDTVERYYNPVVRQLRGLDLPVITAVNGIAAGAGMSLALSGDITLATEQATFDLAFARIGLIPDAGGTYTLQRLLGPGRALSLAILGEKLSAKQAADMGLVWRAVPDADFAQEVDAMAARLATAPTKAIALMKKAFHAGGHHSLEQQLALEAELQSQAADTEDFQEGLSAFLGKRAPTFKGL